MYDICSALLARIIYGNVENFITWTICDSQHWKIFPLELLVRGMIHSIRGMGCIIIMGWTKLWWWMILIADDFYVIYYLKEENECYTKIMSYPLVDWFDIIILLFEILMYVLHFAQRPCIISIRFKYIVYYYD